MMLREAVDRADHGANSGGHSTVISRASNPDKEIRFTYPRPPPNYLGAHLVVEERFFPDKHGAWSDWSAHSGFSVDDLRALDWSVHDACGQPCGEISHGCHRSPGNKGCQNG